MPAQAGTPYPSPDPISAHRAGIRTPALAHSSRSRARAIGATPVWSMSLTAVRASAAIRGAVTWSAMRRSAGMSATPRLRARSSRSCWQAWSLVSFSGADAVASGLAGDCWTGDCRAGGCWAGACGGPPQPAASAATAAAKGSTFIRSVAAPPRPVIMPPGLRVRGEDVVDRFRFAQAGGGGPAADELMCRGPPYDVLVAGGVVIADERHLADVDGE